MKKVLLVLTFMVLAVLVSAQLNQGEFTYGGPENDVGNSLVETMLHGFVIVGYTASYGHGATDIYVIKTDSVGNVIWTKTIGSNHNEIGYSVIRENLFQDERYTIIGYSDSCGGSTVAYIAHLDENGNILWHGIFGVINSGYSIIQTKDGGYALTGYFNMAMTYKLNSTHSFSWGSTLTCYYCNGSWGSSIIQSNDGGTVTCGTVIKDSGVSSLEHVYVYKQDSLGNLVWSRVIGGNRNDIGNSIIRTKDKGYAVAGMTYSFDDSVNGDMYVIKLDSSGKLQWTRTIGDTGVEEGKSIIQSGDGGFVVAGYTSSYGAGGKDVYVVKLNSAGNLQWARTIGGKKDDGANQIIQTKDGGYAITGYTYSFGNGAFTDVYFVKLDSNGNSCSSVNSAAGIDSGGVIIESGGNAVMNKDTMIHAFVYDTGCIKTTLCSVIAAENDIGRKAYSVSVYPNPSRGAFTLTLTAHEYTPHIHVPLGEGATTLQVYNMLGELVKSAELGGKSTNIDLSNNPPGIYMYRVLTDTGKLVGEGKLIIE